MTALPPDYPQRAALAEEVHARPPETIAAPARATYVAVLVAHEDRERERLHIGSLCERFSISGPAAGATHFSAQLGPLRLKWERHGAFSGLTFIATDSSAEPFGQPALELLPTGWLAMMPGRTVAAAHAALLPASTAVAPPSAWSVSQMASYFCAGAIVGAEIGDGAGFAFTNFRIHADGCARFLVIDRSMTARQSGRILQRLFEIEAYRMPALLALPVARQESTRILAVERELASLTASIASSTNADETLLHELTRLAAEVESALACSQFRFGACRAYSELVMTRIGELREVRQPGMQTIEEFMSRRFKPAVATCATVSQRLHDLSERVAQASALLSTRVDIVLEQQNQALLASMNRRAKQQLRLQQTVEGLSVAAIVYYVVGLVRYMASPAKAAGLRIDVELLTGLSIPVAACIVLYGMRGARRALEHDNPDGALTVAAIESLHR